MKKNARTITIAIVLALVGALLLGLIVGAFLDSRLKDRQIDASTEKLALVETMVADMDSKAAQLTNDFDQIFISAADTMALMAQTVPSFTYDTAQMQELQEIVSADNVLAINANGEIICSANVNPRDYTTNRFNQLRDAFNDTTGTSAAPFTVVYDDITVRYYGAKIDDEHMIVIARSAEALNTEIASAASLKSTLSDVRVGQNGFVAVVSTLDHTVEYFPDESIVGTNAVTHGLDPELLEDGVSTYLDFNKGSYLCTMKQIGDKMYICAVPKGEIVNNRNLIVGICVLIFVLTVAVMIMYAVFVRKDKTVEAQGKEFRKLISGRLIAIAVVGAILVFALVVYCASLLSISRQSVTNNHRLDEAIAELDTANEQRDYIEQLYNDNYVAKAKLAALIIGGTDEANLTYDFMVTLQKALKVNKVNCNDMDGVTIASSDKFWSFTLSTDPNAQSYEFRKILEGTTDQIVQEPQKEDSSNDVVQYIGVAIKDANYRTTGLVCLEVAPTLLPKLLQAASTADVLSTVQPGNSGFAFSIDKDSKKFTYYPNSDLVGRLATDNGVAETQLVPGFNEFITINGEQYYCASSEYGNDLVYIAVPMSKLNNMSVPVAGVAFGFAFVWLLLLWFVLSAGIVREAEAARAKEKKRREAVLDAIVEEQEKLASASEEAAEEAAEAEGAPAGEAAEAEGAAVAVGAAAAAEAPAPEGAPQAEAVPAAADQQKPEEMISVDRGDGRRVITRSILNRFSNKGVPWHDMTAGQKVGTVVKAGLAVVAIALFLLIMFADSVFGEDSVVRYVLNGSWEKGLNIFALTKCFMSIVTGVVIAMIARKLIDWFAERMGAKGETICRLLNNFIKFGVAIGLCYICLDLLGVDTSVLLTSAGILSLVVGLGANGLIKDAIAGIMIVFEGAFQVGDIVTIGGFRGTVVEIGIRTTKVKAGDGNVKVFANGSIGDILNMTQDRSVVAVDMSIEYGEDLERVERILEEEFEGIRDRLPAITEGPLYKGVAELADSAVIIKIIAKCEEGSRAQLDRDLRRELKLVFDKHGINIPFPQVVINEP
ncbi:MAG: mechanosensitive ion channel [Coriobacteriia bacterium]|nr:mechanosensitive ion channel [Coriobacteriia bacterium]